MARLRSFAAIAIVASLLLATAGTATAASSVKAARANFIPVLPGIPFIDFGFPCFAPFVGDTGAQAAVLQTTNSIVILTTSQNPTPFTSLNGNGPSMFLGSGLTDVMKCFFTYPAGTFPGAPFTTKDFFCDYENNDVSHVFDEQILIVRDTWALKVCLGSAHQNGTGSAT